MSAAKREADLGGFALHGDQASEPILGRLVERGLHDELKGAAYAIIDGVDGRTHHLVFSDLEMTGDAKPGAIVEARAYSAPVWHDDSTPIHCQLPRAQSPKQNGRPESRPLARTVDCSTPHRRPQGGRRRVHERRSAGGQVEEGKLE